MKIIFRFFIFVCLTLLTQIGGLVYLMSLYWAGKWKREFKGKKWLCFLLLYGVATYMVVPFLAPLAGRERVAHQAGIRPANYMTILLNRNYVKAEINERLGHAAQKLENTPIRIRYLDANFPFINGFPLLPHLSHDDGEKIDIGFVYEQEDGTLTALQKSRSGYGVFAAPQAGEKNTNQWCKSQGYFQYDFTKYLSLGQAHPDLVFSTKGSRLLLQTLLEDKGWGKVFIEPHLKTRLALSDSRIRFHGCRAVRHDDHIHLQLP